MVTSTNERVAFQNLVLSASTLMFTLFVISHLMSFNNTHFLTFSCTQIFQLSSTHYLQFPSLIQALSPLSRAQILSTNESVAFQNYKSSASIGNKVRSSLRSMAKFTFIGSTKEMGSHHHQVAILVPDDKLECLGKIKIIFVRSKLV